MLKSLEVRKAKKLRKQSDMTLKQKKVELALKTELLHKLDTVLSANDRVCFEVTESVLGDFLTVLSSKAVQGRYDFEQLDSNIFVFTNKLTAI